MNPNSINYCLLGKNSVNNISSNLISPTKKNKIEYTIENKLKQLKIKYGEHIIDPEKSPDKLKDKEKQKRSMQRSKMLFESAKIKNEVQKSVFEKGLEYKKELEIKPCTFKPKVNANLQRFINENKPIKFDPRNIYDRQFSLMLTKREK